MRQNVALVVLALFSFVLVGLVALTRRPFTKACAGELAISKDLPQGRPLVGPIEATATVEAGPGEPGKLVRKGLGPFAVGVFSYGHDPPRWYADLLLDEGCYGPQRIGLGLMTEGTIELRRTDEHTFQIVGKERDGTNAFFHLVHRPAPSRMYVAEPAGLALVLAVIAGAIAIAVARRSKLVRHVLEWPEGIVRDDGMLEPLDGSPAIPLACACREAPGKKILFVARRTGDAGPYREHARGGLLDHVVFSREEGRRHATRLDLLALFAALSANAIAVVAFFLTGS